MDNLYKIYSKDIYCFLIIAIFKIYFFTKLLLILLKN